MFAATSKHRAIWAEIGPMSAPKGWQNMAHTLAEHMPNSAEFAEMWPRSGPNLAEAGQVQDELAPEMATRLRPEVSTHPCSQLICPTVLCDDGGGHLSSRGRRNQTTPRSDADQHAPRAAQGCSTTEVWQAPNLLSLIEITRTICRGIFSQERSKGNPCQASARTSPHKMAVMRRKMLKDALYEQEPSPKA